MALYTPQRLAIPLTELSQATNKSSARFKHYSVHGAVTPAQASASYGIPSLPKTKPLSKADIERHFRGLRTGQDDSGAGVVMGRSGAIRPARRTSQDATLDAPQQGPPSPAREQHDSSAPQHTSAPGGSPTVHAAQRRSSSPTRQGPRHPQQGGGPPHGGAPVFSDTERQRFDLLLQRLRSTPPGSTLDEATIVREYFRDDFLSLPVHKVHAETGLTVLAVAMHYQLHGIIQSALAHPGIATTINLPMPALPGSAQEGDVPLPPLLLAILHRVPFLTRQLLAAGASPHVRHPVTLDTALHLACMGFPQPDVKRKKVARRRKKRAKQPSELPMDEPATETPVMRIPSTSTAAPDTAAAEGKEGEGGEGGEGGSATPLEAASEGKHADDAGEDGDAVDPALLSVTPPHKVIDALLYAVSSRRPQARRAYLNRSNAEGMTALHTALDLAFATGSVTPEGVAVPGDISNAAALLAAGASALVRDPRSGMTAWQRIVALGSVPLAATTLEHGGAPMLSEAVLRRQIQHWWAKGTLVAHGGPTRNKEHEGKDAEEDSKYSDEEAPGPNSLPESVVAELVRLNRAGQVDTLRWHLVAWRHAKEQQALHADGISHISLSGFGVATVRVNGSNTASSSLVHSPGRGGAAGRTGRGRSRSRSRSRSPRSRAGALGPRSARSRSPRSRADEFAAMQTLDLRSAQSLGGVDGDQPPPLRASTLDLSSTNGSARGAAAQAHQRAAPGERPSTVHVAQRSTARSHAATSPRGRSPRAGGRTKSSLGSTRGGTSSQQGFRDKKSMTVRLRPAQEKAMCLLLPSMQKGAAKGKGKKKGSTAIGAGGIADRILTSGRASSRKSHSTLGRSSSRAASAHTASAATGVGAASQSSSAAGLRPEVAEHKEDDLNAPSGVQPFADEMPDFDEATPPSEGVGGGASESKYDEAASPAAHDSDDGAYDDEWAD